MNGSEALDLGHTAGKLVKAVCLHHGTLPFECLIPRGRCWCGHNGRLCGATGKPILDLERWERRWNARVWEIP